MTGIRDTQPELIQMLPGRKGHFRFESGHHSDLWLDLELLCLHPEPIQRFAEELSSRIAAYDPEGVCGPLVEGAFVALLVASRLAVPFFYAERTEVVRSDWQFPYDYRIPGAQRSEVRGRRIAIVNDVISAGSAVRGTFADLQACGAKIVAIGCLLLLGSGALQFASEKEVPLERLAALPGTLWTPSECPLCARGVPISNE